MPGLRNYVAAALLSYVAYVTATCPCPEINKCHAKSVTLAVGAAALVTMSTWDHMKV